VRGDPLNNLGSAGQLFQSNGIARFQHPFSGRGNIFIDGGTAPTWYGEKLWKTCIASAQLA